MDEKKTPEGSPEFGPLPSTVYPEDPKYDPHNDPYLWLYEDSLEGY